MVEWSRENFDWSFWVSSTNMKNLMKMMLEAGGQMNSHETQIINMGSELDDIRDQIISSDEDLLEFMGLVNQHISNQQQINQSFFDALMSLTNIVAKHETALKNAGLID